MNIALVFPPSTFLSRSDIWPPLGLFYLAAQLEAQGHHTDFIDMSINTEAFPYDGGYDQLWLSATSPQLFEVRKIATFTKKWQKTKTVFGGAAPWANPKSAMELGFDLVVSGESDHPDTIKEILSHKSILESVGFSKGSTLYTPKISPNLDWVLPPVRRWSTQYKSYMTDRNTGYTYRMASLFTSRGCPMSCAFCIEEHQRVLMADWSWKPIRDVKIGDMVMSMSGGQHTKKYPSIVPTKVLHAWYKGIKDTVFISDAQSSLQLTPDHKVYAHDGHKTRWKRSDSIQSYKYTFRKFFPSDVNTTEFRRGWLAGYIDGDGCIHKRNDKTNITIASRDVEMLDYLQLWAKEFGCDLRRFKHKMGNSIFPTKVDSEYIDAVQCTSGIESDKFLSVIYDVPKSEDYLAGWLAGIYDSDGTLNANTDCRIFQSYRANPEVVEKIEGYLKGLGILYNRQERENEQYVYIISAANFLTRCRPLMSRKYPDHYDYRTLLNWVAKSNIPSGKARVYDIETETGSFICEGFVVHNCESGRHGVIWDALTRYEPIHIVEQQIKEIKDLGFTGLAYYDDIFIINKKRTLQLLELHKKYGMVFRCFLRSDILCKHGGKDYLKQMKDAGLIEIFVGVESASNEIKNNIHKGTTIEQDTLVLQWCKELGITCKMSFILGLPGESIDTLNETRDWILANRPHIVQTDRLIPFPGTPLYSHPEEYDLKYETTPDEEWFFRGRHDADSKSFVSTSHLSVDDIDKFWHDLEAELLSEGLSGYNH